MSDHKTLVERLRAKGPLASLSCEAADRIVELETMVQHLGAGLRRAVDTFEKLAALDRLIDENSDKVDTILAQIEARRQKGKPS